MMVEKYKIRTDLAMEQKERFESDHVEVSFWKRSMMKKRRLRSQRSGLKRKMGRSRWENLWGHI